MAERDLDYVPVLEPAATNVRPPARGVSGPIRDAVRRGALLGTLTKSDLLAEHYDVVKRARAEEFGIT